MPYNKPTTLYLVPTLGLVSSLSFMIPSPQQ